MIKHIVIGALSIWLSVSVAIGQPLSPIPGFPPGLFSGRGALDAAPAGGSFTGPGDIVSFNWWTGLRAYSAATAGTKAINLCDDTGANCSDISTNASTGVLNAPGTHGANNCNTSATCRIATFYDKVGTDDCTQATNANRATLNFTGGPGGAFAAAVFVRASSESYPCGTSPPSPTAQPFSISSVSERTGTTGSFNTVMSVGGADVLYNSGANACGGYAGAVLVDSTHCADNAYHAAQVLYSTTGSVVIDGNTAVTGSIGSGAPSGAYTIGTGIGGLLDGRFLEAGVAAGDQSASFNALNSNQHGTNGYNF
jgi:hypothetical protein